MKTDKKGRPAGLSKKVLTEEEILRDIMTRPTVPLIPHVSWATGLSRASTYAASRRDKIATIDFGRTKRALTAPLRKLLGIEA
jgi:hypothetical protein